MKQLFTFLTVMFLLHPADAQKYITRTGYIGFYSHTPVEDIKADNNQVASVIDLSTGEVVFQVLIKSFSFKKALMQEHFNENYLESDKYPKATFKGKIVDPAPAGLNKSGSSEVNVKGELTLHNVTREIIAKGLIETAGDSVRATSKFIIKPEDYNITIPAIVRNNIAKEVEVTVDIKYARAEK